MTECVARFGLSFHYQIAAGYQDCNDADRLRDDPLFKTVCDRLPQDDGLSSQPTLSRFELGKLQLDTLRLRLIKVAAIVTQSARRILVRQPLAHPWVSTHAALAEWLSPAPT